MAYPAGVAQIGDLDRDNLVIGFLVRGLGWGLFEGDAGYLSFQKISLESQSRHTKGIDHRILRDRVKGDDIRSLFSLFLFFIIVGRWCFFGWRGVAILGRI